MELSSTIERPLHLDDNGETIAGLEYGLDQAIFCDDQSGLYLVFETSGPAADEAVRIMTSEIRQYWQNNTAYFTEKKSVEHMDKALQAARQAVPDSELVKGISALKSSEVEYLGHVLTYSTEGAADTLRVITETGQVENHQSTIIFAEPNQHYMLGRRDDTALHYGHDYSDFWRGHTVDASVEQSLISPAPLPAAVVQLPLAARTTAPASPNTISIPDALDSAAAAAINEAFNITTKGATTFANFIDDTPEPPRESSTTSVDPTTPEPLLTAEAEAIEDEIGLIGELTDPMDDTGPYNSRVLNHLSKRREQRQAARELAGTEPSLVGASQAGFIVAALSAPTLRVGKLGKRSGNWLLSQAKTAYNSVYHRRPSLAFDQPTVYENVRAHVATAGMAWKRHRETSQPAMPWVGLVPMTESLWKLSRKAASNTRQSTQEALDWNKRRRQIAAVTIGVVLGSTGIVGAGYVKSSQILRKLRARAHTIPTPAALFNRAPRVSSQRLYDRCLYRLVQAENYFAHVDYGQQRRRKAGVVLGVAAVGLFATVGGGFDTLLGNHGPHVSLSSNPEHLLNRKPVNESQNLPGTTLVQHLGKIAHQAHQVAKHHVEHRRQTGATPKPSFVIVKQGQNPWTIARHLLERRGNKHPTDNQIWTEDRKIKLLNRLTNHTSKVVNVGRRLFVPKH